MSRLAWRCLLLWCAGIGLVLAARLEGQVIKVVDGDTLEVRLISGKKMRVRLGAIDAPELAQPYGTQSRASLRQSALRRPVSLEVTKRDTHGRAVANAWVASAASCPAAHVSCARDFDLALAQLDAGMAWHYKHYAGEQPAALRSRYTAAERHARNGRRGLWRASRPIPPWDWRRQARP